MPYKIKGKEVLHFKNGKWILKQTAHSHQKAINTVKLLQGLEHGWHPDKSKNCKIIKNILGGK
jgi:Zn/Cd-binding protein ZinT